jgi:hypothetical protein
LGVPVFCRPKYLNRIRSNLPESVDLDFQNHGLDEDLLPSAIEIPDDRGQSAIGQLSRADDDGMVALSANT